MATVTPRSRTEIQRELHRINPEIPLERLQQCLEEHNYDISRVQGLLQEDSNRYHYQQSEDLISNNNLPIYNMDRHPVSPQPSQRQTRSVSEDHSVMPGGHTAQPSLSRGVCNPNGHQKSRTWDQHTQLNYTPLPNEKKLHVDTNFGSVSPVSPRHSPKRSDVGVWVQPSALPISQRSVATMRVANPDSRHSPVPTESSNHSLMTTQQISPVIGQPMTSFRTPNSPSVEDSHTTYSPLVPWTVSKTSSNRTWVQPGGANYVLFPPFNETSNASNWSQQKHTGPKSPPTVITSISSPVAPPVVSITNWEVNKPQGRPVATHDESTNNIGSELKKQTRLQALLAHQKARFDLIRRRVEETKIKTETTRKEVADMENDLDRRRAHTTSSYPTPEAISRLREEKQGLQIDVECLQRDITLNRQRDNSNQDSFNFYRNMPNEHHPAYPSLPLPGTQNQPGPPVERDTNNQWSCHTCSFKNHEYLPECEMCGKPREENQLASGHS